MCLIVGPELPSNAVVVLTVSVGVTQEAPGGTVKCRSHHQGWARRCNSCRKGSPGCDERRNSPGLSKTICRSGSEEAL